MKKYILLAIWSLSASTLIGQTYDPQSDTWVCDDDLGRSVASSDGGVSRSEIDEEAIVGMFYYVWHGQHGTETKDNTRLVAANPENPAFGGWGSFHWGGKPVLGYYTGGTPYIVARHMQMLVDAGIDFYFFDVTNAYIYEAQVKTVMNEIDRRTRLGLKSPKLVFTTHSSSASTVTSIYNAFYTNAGRGEEPFHVPLQLGMGHRSPKVVVAGQLSSGHWHCQRQGGTNLGQRGTTPVLEDRKELSQWETTCL